MAKTLNAAQPCCPRKYTEAPIKACAEKLKTDSEFCRNDVYSSLVSKHAISNDHQPFYVLSESIRAFIFSSRKKVPKNDIVLHRVLNGSLLTQPLNYPGTGDFQILCKAPASTIAGNHILPKLTLTGMFFLSDRPVKEASDQ